MLKDTILRPIKIFGAVLIVIGAIGVSIDIWYLNDPNLSIEFKIFGILISLWHLMSGIGLLLQRSWGLYIFKIYLYVLYLGIPIGSYISFKTLKYIRHNELDKFFS